MNSLFEIQESLFSVLPEKFKRNLYYEIDWNNRLIEITGARGVGKTVLMLQKTKWFQSQGYNALYVSADNPYFYTSSLYDFAIKFYNYGGTHLFIDEVQRYIPKQKNTDWATELKAIYDSFPKLNIIFSGSSILRLYKGAGDLSRRKVSYKLNGLSFREYLEFTDIIKFSPLQLTEIIEKHLKIAAQITKNIKILPLFEKYLQVGYYPFFVETSNFQSFYNRLWTVINLIIEYDIPSVVEIKYETTTKLKKMLSVIATSAPYSAEMKKLSDNLRISDYRMLLKLIDYLDKAELLLQLKPHAKGNKILQKPEKIYLNNSNLLYALDFDSVNKGTVRETFFINQVSENYTVTLPKKGDFFVDNKYVFEVGGKNKDFKQIKSVDNAYLVIDDVSVGYFNAIPLWLFGFLY